ncbi:hypothetical protein Ccrd_009914 [Cynara cardunculus var. scolymus]|uniref:Uncharacterized protein n=1 Tax=Cynara cardunculus var. scolymus TaxID=59895 RepID=A0A103YM61_CYNCS|nr:hypothetical protein Ccrd_009914 [Cynara cardunculus var. scolymus]
MKSIDSADSSSVYKSIEDATDRDVNIRYMPHATTFIFQFSIAYFKIYMPNKFLLSFLGFCSIQEYILITWKNLMTWLQEGGFTECNLIVVLISQRVQYRKVKEVGIYLVDCPTIARKIEVFFNLSFGLYNRDMGSAMADQ